MASRVRSLIEWDKARDELILRDLRRFRGRAIGRRIRQLISLGLEAERLGLRIVEQDGRPVVHVLQPLVPSQTASAPPQTARSFAGEACVTAPALDAEHEAGLEELLNGLGIDFG